jgi:hypothetical protein
MIPALMIALVLQTAPDPALEADLRCLAYLSTAVEKAPAAQQPGLAAGLLYFVGRIDARMPGFDYAAALARTPANAARLADLDREAPRCVRVVGERGRALVAAGQALRAGK